VAVLEDRYGEALPRTEQEKLACAILKGNSTFGTYQWRSLPLPVRVVYMGIAEAQLVKQGVSLAQQDKEAAKTWGGDIDLVSFEGE